MSDRGFVVRWYLFDEETVKHFDTQEESLKYVAKISKAAKVLDIYDRLKIVVAVSES